MGTKEETLTINQIPSHSHTLEIRYREYMAGSGQYPWVQTYDGTSGFWMNKATSSVGGGLPHNNMPPVIVVNYEVVAG